MTQGFGFLSSLPAHTLALGALLAFSLFVFIVLFLIPAIFQGRALNQCIRSLVKVDSKDLGAVRKIFSRNPTLLHLWEEFQDTLHEQFEVGAQGDRVLAAIRQTVPAEAYFSEQILVHSPLKTEFFKHLPGLLTGIGIIGTFSGLILGLQAFDVSDDPGKVRASLEALLHGVYQAFMISAMAITIAMFVTAVEKWTVTVLFQKVEQLCLALDSKYDAGAGEEYLSRLVESSESSATEMRQLKQALVNDLKQILESVAERQIQAQESALTGLSQKIVAGLTEGLQQPMTAIGAAVTRVSGDQGDAVSKLLADTMAAMTAQMRDLFAGQVDGIRGMQQQTIDGLGFAVAKLERFADDISARGAETNQAMAAQLATAVESLDKRQQEMSVQTRELLDSLRVQFQNSQDQTSDGLRAAIDKIAQSVEVMSGALSAKVAEAASLDDERARKMHATTESLASKMSSVSSDLLSQTSEAVEAMRRSVEAMRTTTSETVAKMNLGAADMLKAASEMTSASSAAANTLDRNQNLAKQLTTAASAVENSTSALAGAVNDNRAARDAVAIMVQQLRETADAAKREASLTADVLARIEAATKSLRGAQVEAEKYLEGVTEVLASAHQQFGTQVISTLNAVNGEFHKHVERGTKALGGAIEELDQVLDRIGSGKS